MSSSNVLALPAGLCAGLWEVESIGSTQLLHSRGAASPVVWLHGYA